MVKTSVANFNETGQFDRPFLGVSYRPISEQAALFNDVPQGAYLVEVTPGASADAAGLRAGDILTAINGELIKDQPLAVVLNKKRIGEVITVRYWREGQFAEVEITLQAPQTAPQQ
ncbi:MAG: PDZ domain-containing protein [bacterium]|nr:PDZ domain-containing protein [bacterium]